jgi:hypothetical protein
VLNVRELACYPRLALALALVVAASAAGQLPHWVRITAGVLAPVPPRARHQPGGLRC